MTSMVERMARMEAEMEAKDERIAALEASQARADMGGWIYYYIINHDFPLKRAL